MIWLTWRQHRRHAMWFLIGFAVLAALLIPTGLAIRSAFDQAGLAECIRLGLDAPESCNRALDEFVDRNDTLGIAGTLLVFLPLVVGLFWGAPLVAREVEHGTHRMVWTQGVSRRRWALTKVGLVGGGTLLLAAAYGAGMAWWFAPLNRTAGRFESPFFDVQGLAPIGYTVFAVALGVFAGTVAPRMLPAMGITLAGFVGLRIAVAVLARPRYQAPEELTASFTEFRPADASGNWRLAAEVRGPGGETLRDGLVSCPPGAALPGGRPCGSDLDLPAGAYNWQLYQPGDRFWLFQLIETGIYLALAAVLILLAVRLLRRLA
jgi:hypothetical protein